jgi:glycosyltransferase involved in cell wall biosynthesis
MKLSVIIPCFNGAKTLAAQLETLTQQHWSEPWEIILSNNGSTDNSVEIARSYQSQLPNLRIVDSSSQKGRSYALNMGAIAAKGEFLAFCDADDELAAGWVAAMGEALTKFPFVAGAMECTKLNEPWVQRSRHWQQQADQIPEFAVLPAAYGCNLGIHRSLHEAVKGYDPAFQYGSEDEDYCWRVRQRGIDLRFVPKAVVHYRFRDTLKGMYKQQRSYGLAEMQLYKKFGHNRPDWFPPLSWKRLVHSWFTVLKMMPKKRHSRELWAIWLVRFGAVTGQLSGFIKHFVLKP